MRNGSWKSRLVKMVPLLLGLSGFGCADFSDGLDQAGPADLIGLGSSFLPEPASLGVGLLTSTDENTLQGLVSTLQTRSNNEILDLAFKAEAYSGDPTLSTDVGYLLRSGKRCEAMNRLAAAIGAPTQACARSNPPPVRLVNPNTNLPLTSGIDRSER